MARLALLVAPNANRVYGQTAPALAAAELEVVGGDQVRAVEQVELGGVPYLTFEVDAIDVAASFVGSLSSTFACFEVEGERLRPIKAPRSERYDDDLVTIPRYTGKTNEAFTKLLVNVTRAAATVAGGHQVRLLDPVCGRGTTLSVGLVNGFRVAGIEIEGRAVDAYEQVLTTWLQDKRLKHTVDHARIRRDGKVVGRRFDVIVGSSKAELAAGGATTVSVVNDDARVAAKHFAMRSIDVIAGDLPYGVQHGSGPAGERTRNPLTLVQAGLAEWRQLLRAGGAIGLSFNTKVLPRAEIASAMAAHGLEVMDGGPWLRFEHRVDRTIQRDLIVARA